MTQDKKNQPSVSSNYILNTVVNILGLIVPLITTPYISRVLGAEPIGVFNYCYSIEIYFAAIGQLGIPIYAKREIAKIRTDQDSLNEKFNEIFTLQIFSVTTAMMVYAFCIQFFEKAYVLVFIACGIDMISNAINVTWLYVGLEDFKLIAKRNIIFRVLSVILVFTFVKNSDDLYIYILCMTFSNLVCSLMLFFKARDIIKWKKPKLKKVFKNLKPTFILMLPGLVTTIYTVIDEVMLGSLSGQMAQVGMYEQSQKLVRVCMMVITSMGIVLMPRLAALFGGKDYGQFKSYVTKAVSAICFIAMPMAVGVFFISDNIVPWFYGPGFEPIKTLLKIFAPMLVFIGITDILGSQVLISTGKEKQLLVINLIAVGINLTCNFFLIPEYKAFGAAFATVAAEFSKCMIIMYLNHKYINTKKFVKEGTKYLCISLIMYVCLFAVDKAFNLPATVLSTVIYVLIASILYGTILIITKDQWALKALNILKSITKKIKRK